MTEYIFLYATLILILGLTIFSLYLGNNHKTKTTHWLSIIMFCTIAYLAISLICETFEGKVECTSISTIFNLIAYFTIDCVLLAFLKYVLVLLNKTNRPTKILSWTIVATTIIRVTTIIVLFATGNLFSIVEGKYIEGPLNYIPYVMAAISIVELIILVIFNRKSFSTKQFVVVLIYELIPIAPIIIESYTNYYCLSGIFLTVSVLLIFLLLQESTIKEGIIKQELYEEMSKKDLLTDVNNRRGYYDTIQEISNDDLVGIIFCDLNGLKNVNDHFGHAAGDKLLKDFAALLLESFKPKEVFRISGDEFIVIIQNKKQEQFIEEFNNFKEIIVKQNYVAAIGSSFGSGDCLDKLISYAESDMYQDKAIHGVIRH